MIVGLACIFLLTVGLVWIWCRSLRQRTEIRAKELRESEEKYRSLFEAANDIIVMVDREGYIRFANPKSFEVTGYSPEELKKLHFADFLHPDDAPLMVDRFKRRLAGEEVESRYEFRALTKDKRVLYMEGKVSPVEKEGRIIGIQAIVRDISERKYLEKSLKKRIDELDALYDSTRQIATSLDLDQVLDTITQGSANLLGVDGVIVRLADTEQETLRVLKVHNLRTDSQGLRVMKLGEGVLGQVLLKGEPMAVEDIEREPRYLHKEWAKKEGFISFLAVPLESRKQVIGTLSFLSRKRRLFREEEISLALAFANQAAIAIENARLYDKTKRSLLGMKKLNEILSAISSLSDVSRILRLIVNTAIRFTGGQRSVIMIVDKEKQKIHQAAMAASSREFSYPVKEAKPDGITWRIIKEKKPISVKVKLTHSPELRPKHVENGSRTVLGLPLIGQERILGSLIICSTSPNAFRREEVQILSMLANQAAIAIEKSELIATLKQAQIRLQNWGRELEEKVKEKTEELQRSHSYLFQSEKLAGIGQLAAGVAHEMRNPLGVIATSLYYLSNILSPQDKNVKRHFEIMDAEISRCQIIINNLLEFSRKSEKEFELVDANRLLEMSLSLVEKDFLVRDIRLVREMSHVSKIFANMDEMKQVFLNLILNATQSMPKGGEIRVETSMVGKEKIRIRIQDTGVGIAQEDLSEIFNPFFTTKGPGEGTGLGLSLVHSVIESYHGTIRVESKEGKGTSFIIELPAFQEKGQGGK